MGGEGGVGAVAPGVALRAVAQGRGRARTVRVLVAGGAQTGVVGRLGGAEIGVEGAAVVLAELVHQRAEFAGDAVEEPGLPGGFRAVEDQVSIWGGGGAVGR